MTSLNIITNITGFEQALEDVKERAPDPVTEVRLAVSRKVKASELGARQGKGGVLVVGCNAADKYLVGVAIMSVFETTPTEYQSSRDERESEMLGLMKRQTVALEDLVKIIRARA